MADNNGSLTQKLARDWCSTMRVMGLKYGNIIVLDPLLDNIWIDMSTNDNLEPPHLKSPYVPALCNNKKLQSTIAAIKVILVGIKLPILIIILPTHPRYLSGPCCSNCEQDWDPDTSPELFLGMAESIDIEIANKLKILGNSK